MAKYQIEQTAYVKLVLHALKHRTSAVNGILIGRLNASTKSSDIAPESAVSSTVEIVDAVPLFHGQIGLLPMLELALLQVDEYLTSSKEDHIVVGYYHANELFDDYELNGIARKISDQLARYYPQACCLLLDNRLLEALPKESSRKPVLQLYTRDATRGWRLATSSDLVLKEPTANGILNDFILDGKDQLVVDFDEHLDDVSKDWLNPNLFD
ncbi:hypothetical protein O6H91_05G096400 [Diphasiastrum complanatum]|uniref:Uncharacterized protein n=1 Tax=Diphasiastrum complanatum TaxID=34168 RepID=A0ACC2DRB3_DIPCM|nr:hypothetical protein O6H91_05G096400 [Diphasiastrum complanatum]